MPTRRSATVRPLLSDMPGLRNTSVPAADRLHPWIKQQTFYTLPVGLWKAVIKELGSSRFKADDIALEFRLSEICEDHSVQVGFRDGQPVLFNRLRTISLSFPKPDCDEWRTKSDAEWKACLRQLDVRADYFSSIIRGYLGWLLTTPLFLNEHDHLWEGASEELIGASIPRRIEARRIEARRSGHDLPDGWQLQPDSASGVAAQFRDFCSRWQLSQIAGPYLPVPVEPRIPNLLASQQAAPQFQIPGIIAIDGGGLVREMITDSLKQPRAEHLAEWMQIVEPDNQGRKTIHRFARLFELQHYSRALAQRHSKALAGKKENLRHAFAIFFGRSDDTIRSDLQLLKKRLGRGHYQAPAWLDAI